MSLLKSFAKINLYLNVTSKYANGYHGIKSIFAQVDLADTIECTVSNGGVHIIGCDDIPLEENLMYKAYKAFVNHTGITPQGITLKIEKHIPQGGGLGGGSSNCATVLVGLNQIFNTRLSKSTLAKIGSKLGADVPYFIYGGFQKVCGFGQIVSPIKTKTHMSLILLLPHLHVDTKNAYKQMDCQNLVGVDYFEQKKYHILRNGLEQNNLSLICQGIYNKFEQVAFKEFPKLEEIKHDISDCGALSSFMSGSGSTMVGLFSDDNAAKVGLATLKKQGYDALLCHTI